MKITGIDYERLFSLGQYENERVGLHAEVDPETENIFDCFKDLKATALSLQKEGLLIEESKAVAESETPKEAEKPTQQKYDLMKVVTVQAQGSKGPYLKITKANNQNNSNYDALIADLKAHKGKLTKQGYFVFLFDDQETAGMKPSKR